MRKFAVRLLPAAVGASLLAGLTPAGTTAVVLVESTARPGMEQPEARAASLRLPTPTRGPSAGHQVCTSDVTGEAPTVCFPSQEDADDFIDGREHGRSDDAHEITLSGTGGQVATSLQQLYYSMGKTCNFRDCSGQVYNWWAINNANCTHSYPANDYYRNNMSGFVVYYPRRDYDNNYSGSFNNNCGTVAIYRDGTQGGAGAKLCAMYVSSDPKTEECQQNDYTVVHYSISWHFG